MRTKGILVTVVVLLGVLFAVLNWSVLFAPVPVNLLVATAELPLGITLLLAALLVALAFFLVSLFDRAAQLRHLTRQERVIESLYAKLERRRLQEMERLEAMLGERFDTIQRQLEQGSGRVEANLRESLSDMEMREAERLAVLEERVLLVRNELAADVAELEDRLFRPALDEGSERP